MEPRLYQLKSTKPQKNPTPNGRANLPNIVTPGYVFRGKLRATVLKGYFMLFSIHPWISIQRALMSIMIPENLLTRWKAYKRATATGVVYVAKSNSTVHSFLTTPTAHTTALFIKHLMR